MQPTTTIETPIGKVKVEIKQWITGRQREYIEGATYSGMTAKPRVQGRESTVDIGQVDIEKMITGMKHRAIETFVVSVGEEKDKTKILDVVLDMHEEDTDFIVKSIDEITKKKGAPVT